MDRLELTSCPWKSDHLRTPGAQGLASIGMSETQFLRAWLPTLCFPVLESKSHLSGSRQLPQMPSVSVGRQPSTAAPTQEDAAIHSAAHSCHRLTLAVAVLCNASSAESHGLNQFFLISMRPSGAIATSSQGRESWKVSPNAPSWPLDYF